MYYRFTVAFKYDLNLKLLFRLIQTNNLSNQKRILCYILITQDVYNVTA